MLSDLIDHLLAVDEINQVIEGRIWEDRARQGKGFPYLVVSQITGSADEFLGTLDDSFSMIFQVDIGSPSKSQVKNIGDIVFAEIRKMAGSYGKTEVHEIVSQGPPTSRPAASKDGSDRVIHINSRDFSVVYDLIKGT